MRSVEAAVLTTHSVEEHGYPFGSLTPYALLPDGRIAMYLSTLAQNTHNLEADSKLSMPVLAPEDASGTDAQAGGRVSILGNAHRLPKQGDAETGARWHQTGLAKRPRS